MSLFKVKLRMGAKIRLVFIMVLCLIVSTGGYFLLKPFFLQQTNKAQFSKKILYWIDPMEPHIHYEGPGKSRMNMDLIPVYEEEQKKETTTLQISPNIVNSLGVRTAPVEEGPMSMTIKAFGSIKADETKIAHIHTYVDGWIQKLHTKATDGIVEKDQPLFEIYSRNLVFSQKEYLLTLKDNYKEYKDPQASKLKALGVSEKQIKELLKTNKSSPLVTIYAPQKGFVDSLNIREGMYVSPETTVMSLTDLSDVWVIAEIFPSQFSFVKEKQVAKIYLPQSSYLSWQGEVDYIYPTIDLTSQTLKVRIRLSNPEWFFKPNMLVAVEIQEAPKQALTIPSEAVIWSSNKQHVILALGEGKFQARQVTTGIQSEGRIEILSGLNKGERVVTSSQFLLDSDINLKAGFERLEDSSASPSEPSGPPS